MTMSGAIEDLAEATRAAFAVLKLTRAGARRACKTSPGKRRLPRTTRSAWRNDGCVPTSATDSSTSTYRRSALLATWCGSAIGRSAAVRAGRWTCSS